MYEGLQLARAEEIRASATANWFSHYKYFKFLGVGL